MIPCSSPRSSGWRATDWIIEPKTVPMPMPAPSEPRPMPRPKPSACAALMVGEVAASKWSTGSSLVGRLDGRADVDGGERGEDERLDGDDDHDLEDVEGDPDRERDDGDDPEGDPAQDEEEPDRDEDQHVAREHVRVEPDAEADHAEDVRDRLEHGHHRHHRARHAGGHEALEVREAVVTNALDVGEEDAEDREHEGHRELRRHGVDPPRRHAVPLLSRERQRDEADEVHREDEEEERRDVREPAADRLRGQTLLRDLRLRELVDCLPHGLPLAGQEGEPAAHREEPERNREQRRDREVDDRLVDRHVERAEVDRDPLLELELVRGVERPGGQQPAHPIFSPLKYSTSETPSESEYASA